MAKRVVTGHDREGRAVFVSDDEVDPIRPALAPGYGFTRLWSYDTPPSFPDDGSHPEAPIYFPPHGGARFMTVVFPPDSSMTLDGVDIDEALAEIDELLPGMNAHMERDHPGMHTTASIDFDYLVSGRLVLELDDGATIELEPGDSIIQNGTRHAWRNPYDEPATMVVTLLGVKHDNVS